MDELKRLRREAKADAERVARGELPAFRTGSGAEVHAGPEAKRQVDRDLADVLPVAVHREVRPSVVPRFQRVECVCGVVSQRRAAVAHPPRRW